MYALHLWLVGKPEEDRATVTGDLHKILREDRFSVSRDMLADRQTHRQTDRNTPLSYRAGVNIHSSLVGEVENECISHNSSLFAIFLAKIIKIGGNLTKFCQKQFCTVF